MKVQDDTALLQITPSDMGIPASMDDGGPYQAVSV